MEAAASTAIQVEVEAAEASRATQVEEEAEVATKSYALTYNLRQAARKAISVTCFTLKGSLEAMEEDTEAMADMEATEEGMVAMQEDMEAMPLAGELLEDKTSS